MTLQLSSNCHRIRRGLSSGLGLSAAFVCVGHLLISWLLSAGAAPPSPVRLGLIVKSDDTVEPLVERLYPLKRHRCMIVMFYSDCLSLMTTSLCNEPTYERVRDSDLFNDSLNYRVNLFVFKGVLRTNSKVTSMKEIPPP